MLSKSNLKRTLIAFSIFLVFFGGTIAYFKFVVVNNSSSYDIGINQIKRGEYASAIKTLQESLKNSTNKADIYLALAQAYVGTDQIDKAWSCIDEARVAGKSLSNNPELASMLVSYYTKKEDYSSAIQILRPLVQEGDMDKKSQLADLDALWGDKCLEQQKYNQALVSWEEVKQLNCGTRYNEANQKLTIIYNNLAQNCISNKQDKEALAYLSKLDNVSNDYKSHEKASQIYESEGNIVQAISELRKACELSNNNSVKTKLVELLSSYGKELINKGDSENGMAYLQEAQKFDANAQLPDLTIKNFNIKKVNGNCILSGDITNNTEANIDSLTISIEAVNKDKIIDKSNKVIIDQFSPPLESKSSTKFNVSLRSPNASDFKVYLNNNFYKLFTNKNNEQEIVADESDTNSTGSSSENSKETKKEAHQNDVEFKTTDSTSDVDNKANNENSKDEINNEEKTLKELEN